MRALLIAAVGALLSASPAEAASLFTTTSRVQGAVTERFGPELDSFALDSDTVGRPDLSGSAEDPGGTATSGADVDLQTATVVGGELLTAQGSASARSGLPVRESDSTSGVVAEFFLTKAATYQAAGTLSGSNVAGQCCRVSSARLTDEDGNKLFESVVSQGQADKSLTSSGTLPPGEYRLQIEASSGFGFGAAASDTTGTAAFDVTFTLSLPGADADGDALPDTWETDGVDVDGNGSIDLDLPGMGADPRHKDLFVELDFMPPHRFDAAAAAQIADAFADAPVSTGTAAPASRCTSTTGPTRS